DISRRKQAEKDIRTLNASLERRVAERTSELESMLANATVGLAFFDRELRCIRINSPASPTEKRSCVVSYYPVCDAGGAVISVGMTVTDITERKESEEALAALNRALTAEVAMRTQVEQHMRRLADVVEASPDLVGMADSQGRIFGSSGGSVQALKKVDVLAQSVVGSITLFRLETQHVHQLV